MSDYYSRLGVDKQANDNEIKKAYRKKAQEFHPDKNPNDKEAEQKFKDVQEAYEVLSHKQKRSQYDQFGSRGGFPGGTDGHGGFDSNQFGGFADIFESFFGGAQRQGTKRKAGPKRGGDIEVNIDIKFEEAIFGTTTHLEITKPEACDHCEATGAEPGTKIIKCSECGGSGQVRTSRQTILGQISSVHVCPQCLGRGEFPEKKCSQCNGQTRVQKKGEVSVKIPKGIENGTSIRLKEKGSAGALGGTYGDLFIHVRVMEHPKFSREGMTIYSAESIHLLQAVLGAKIQVDTVHGKTELKIPAGTQNGSEFVLKEKGAPSIRNEKLGDHKIMIRVEIPKKLSRKEKELYEQLANEGKINVNNGGFSLF